MIKAYTRSVFRFCRGRGGPRIFLLLFAALCLNPAMFLSSKQFRDFRPIENQAALPWFASREVSRGTNASRSWWDEESANNTGYTIKFGEASTVGVLASGSHHEHSARDMPRRMSTIQTKSTKDLNMYRITSETKMIAFYSMSRRKCNFGFSTDDDNDGYTPFVAHHCPVNDCRISTIDHSRRLYSRSKQTRRHTYNLSQLDAIIWSPLCGELPPNEDIEKWRLPHQRFVLMHMENPLVYPTTLQNLNYQHHFFNWTMTYRWDSDIPRPYGWFQEKELKENNQQKKVANISSFYPVLRHSKSDWIPYDSNMFEKSLPKRSESFKALANRPGEVAWIVSNCQTPSKREEYVQSLQKYINVTILGQCGNQNHTKNFDDDTFEKHVEPNFKFYLGFENAFCNDYVTEKLFARMQQMVVIVLGQADYSRIAPPHSYIRALDFNHPKDLASFLKDLAQNPQEYLSYFWWKDYYTVHPKSFSKRDRSDNFAQSICRLCERLHDADKHPEKEIKTYGNLSQWWHEGQCHRDPLSTFLLD